MNPKIIGERSEAQVIACFLRHGLVVLQPFGDSQRYDLVIDIDGLFVRIQCKTAKTKGDVLIFPTCSVRWNGRSRDYRGEADFFAVYSPDFDTVYIVPVSGVGKKKCSLRLKPAKNSQSRGIRIAKDYEFSGNVSQFKI